ncbi:MAG: hypothetical protein ACI4F4_07350 [Lachnospiraceae bacterium]
MREQKNNWWMLGTVKIPKDKREEMNHYVMEVLDKGGIRKTEEIKVGDCTLTVVKKPVADDDGIVHFNYSIFEKSKFEDCIYDTNTCKLKLSYFGGNEFAFIMICIMLLQESYSMSQCCLMYKDGIAKATDVFLSVMYSMTGKKFNMEHRSKLWDMFVFLRDCMGIAFIEGLKVLDLLPWGFAYWDTAQFDTVSSVKNKKMYSPVEKAIIHHKSEIDETKHVPTAYFMYETMQHLYEKDKEGLKNFLYRIISMNLNDRKKLAKRDDDYGNLACASLYVLPAMLLNAYSIVAGKDFWKLWDSLECKPYKHILNKDITDTEDSAKSVSLSKVIQRNDEDEFMEFWDGENLVLSQRMKERLDEWKHQINEVEDILEDDVVPYLVNVINELYDVWYCRYVDDKFVTLILENKTNPNFRKALVLLHQLMHEDDYLFPELTKSQAKEWIEKRGRSSHDKYAMVAFQSLMINDSQRKQILGF